MKLLFLLNQIITVSSLARLGFPLPEDYIITGAANAGQSIANCGHNPPLVWGQGYAGATSFKPGFATIQIQELVSQNGPYRLCILDKNEVCRYILLDHIPQNVAGPINYNVDVYFPDVKCDASTQCKLQLLWILTGGEECKYYDRNPREQTVLPRRVVPITCTSFLHSCASITISGARSLDSVAPLIAYSASTFEGTFNLPTDGQPSGINGGYSWPYSSSAGYRIGQYSVNGKPLEIARYGLNGFLPALASTALGKVYDNGAPTQSPTLSVVPTPSTTASPSVNFNEVPTLPPAVSSFLTGSQSLKGMDAGSIVTAIIGVIFFLSISFSSLCCSPFFKDLFFGPAVPPSDLVDLKAGRFELGALDYEDDPESWEQLESEDGQPYWFNSNTAQRSFDTPDCIAFARSDNPLQSVARRL